MTAAQAGNRRLIGQITRRVRDGLLQVIIGLTPTREDAEDILQDVLYQFVDKFEDIRSVDRATAWLYRVARNRVTDWYRQRSRRPGGATLEEPRPERQFMLPELLPDSAAGPQRQYAQAELASAVEKALDKLPPAQRDVFIWHEIDGLSFKEMADLTGDSVNTLLSRKRYAVRDLREQLKYFKL